MPFIRNRTKPKHLNSQKYVKIKPKQGFIPVLTKNGLLYEGNWVDDLRQGFGVFAKRIPDRTFKPKYRGNWFRDKRHGIGNGYYVNGGYYVGEWKDGRRSGYGRMWYTDCTFYDGEWRCDQREGIGLFVKANGDRYEGNWEKDKKHGFGRFFHLNTGQMQEGVWFEDAAIVSTMEDIPFRQTVIAPTEYPIQNVKPDSNQWRNFHYNCLKFELELKNWKHVLINAQMKVFEDEELFRKIRSRSVVSDAIEEAVIIELQVKYKYV